MMLKIKKCGIWHNHLYLRAKLRGGTQLYVKAKLWGGTASYMLGTASYMVVACEIIMSSLGTGGTLYSNFPRPKCQVPSPSPSPSPSRWTIWCLLHFQICNKHHAFRSVSTKERSSLKSDLILSPADFLSLRLTRCGLVDNKCLNSFSEPF